MNMWTRWRLLIPMIAVVAMSCKQQTIPAKVEVLSAAEHYDLRFIDTATVHYQYSIEMARAGERQITHPALMAMMTRMIDGKTAERRQLAVWRTAWYGPDQRNVYDTNLPGALSMKMDMSLPASAAGDAWDAAFLDKMIPHMEAMIAMASDAARKASHPELRSFAVRMIPVLQGNISTMRSWEREWRGAQAGAHPLYPAARISGTATSSRMNAVKAYLRPKRTFEVGQDSGAPKRGFRSSLRA